MKLNFTKRDTNIIKGMAILFLLVHHCFLSPNRYKGLEVIFSPFTQGQINLIAQFLKICVPMFVFLTAYGITISLKNKYKTIDITGAQMIQYTSHRLLRLYSGWIFVFVLCEAFCMIYSGLPMKIYGADIQGVIYFLIDALGISNLFGTPTLVGTWWYMSLAITLVLCIPLLIKIYNKIGFVYFMAVFMIIVRQLQLTESSLIHWTPAVLLGIVCADKNLLVKMTNYKIIKNCDFANKVVKLIIGIVILAASFIFRQSGLSSLLFEIKDGVIPFFVIYFIFEFITGIKYLNSVLWVIGKYSMNIFLIHTIIRATYFREFIYGFKYVPIIVGILLIISLILSIAVEWLKKLLRYEKFISAIQHRIEMVN